MKSVIIDAWNEGIFGFVPRSVFTGLTAHFRNWWNKVWSNSRSTSAFQAKSLLFISITQYTSCDHFIAPNLNQGIITLLLHPHNKKLEISYKKMYNLIIEQTICDPNVGFKVQSS